MKQLRILLFCLVLTVSLAVNGCNTAKKAVPVLQQETGQVNVPVPDIPVQAADKPEDKKDDSKAESKEEQKEEKKVEKQEEKKEANSQTPEIKVPIPNNVITDPEVKKALEDLPKGLSNERFGWWFTKNKEHMPPVIAPKTMKDITDRHDGIYLGDTSRKVIYLTFDEGYENGYTPKILDTLKKNNVKATFFITAPYFKGHFQLVERMIKEGHVVGNHTVNHPSMPKLSDAEVAAEITGLHKQVAEKLNYHMNLFRPPMGEFSERTLAITQKLGYKTVFWSFAYADWDVNDQKGADYAYNQVMENYHNGQVLLLHAVSKDNTEALDRMIKSLKDLGYSFETPNMIKE